MTWITDERLKEMRADCDTWDTTPNDVVATLLDELIERRAAAEQSGRCTEGPAVLIGFADEEITVTPASRRRVTVRPGAEAAAPEMFNGLTEEQTAATASVAGLSAQPEAPAVPADVMAALDRMCTPPKMTDAEIAAALRTLYNSDQSAQMSLEMDREAARVIESARDEQWRAALGGKV